MAILPRTIASVFSTIVLTAQLGNAAECTGKVVTAANSPMGPEALVRLIRIDDPGLALVDVNANAEGIWTCPANLKPGRYLVQAGAPRFAPSEVSYVIQVDSTGKVKEEFDAPSNALHFKLSPTNAVPDATSASPVSSTRAYSVPSVSPTGNLGAGTRPSASIGLSRGATDSSQPQPSAPFRPPTSPSNSIIPATAPPVDNQLEPCEIARSCGQNYELSFTLSPLKPNGTPWDVDFVEGKPEIGFCVTFVQNGSLGTTVPRAVAVAPTTTRNCLMRDSSNNPYCRDSLTCKLTMLIPSTSFRIEVYDIDLIFDDFVGAAICDQKCATSANYKLTAGSAMIAIRQIPYAPPPGSLCDISRLMSVIEEGKVPKQTTDLYQRMMGALYEMERSRDRFVKSSGTDNLLDLFPTAYANTTRAEMARIAAGEFRYPDVKLRQMIAFYDAYKFNREAWEQRRFNEVERHWRTHFETATGPTTLRQEANPYENKIVRTIESGMQAHIISDFPRALDFAYRNGGNRISWTDALPDFRATEATFASSLVQTKADLASRHPERVFAADLFDWVARNNPTSVPVEPTDARMSDYIKALRNRAWNEASSGELRELRAPEDLASSPQTMSRLGARVCPALR